MGTPASARIKGRLAFALPVAILAIGVILIGVCIYRKEPAYYGHITREQYGHINPGMTIEEIETVTGWSPTYYLNGRASKRWWDGRTTVSVGFRIREDGIYRSDVVSRSVES